MAAMTKTEKPPTLEGLRQQRADLVRVIQRATSILNPMAYGEARGAPPDTIEVLEAPELLERSRRELRTLDIAIKKAELEVDAAHRTAQAAALAEGRRLVEAELPALVKAQRELQRRWQAFATKLEACDHAAGGMRHFAPAGWPEVMAPGGVFDGFVTYMAAGYRLDLE